ncbi:Uncharacterized protein HZ326_3187 [Fusarium oxysporum f. sp. albedinis]|nr:Uncharacterized protein HZ326_3187 [Fusarium oxysporum f. sp. albedinis]
MKTIFWTFDLASHWKSPDRVSASSRKYVVQASRTCVYLLLIATLRPNIKPNSSSQRPYKHCSSLGQLSKTDF